MKRIFWLALIVFLVACQGGGDEKAATQNNASIPKTRSDSLYQQLMEGHDVGMGRMGELIKYQNAVQKQIDSIDATPKPDARRKAGLTAVLEELEYAEESMNLWMQEFDPNNAGATEADKERYYASEKSKVDKVNENIRTSIDKARTVVGQK